MVGGHVSAAGGLQEVVARARERQFDVIQLFASPPQGYKPITHTIEEAHAFRDECRENNISAVFFHAIYLLNLASEKPFIVHQSKQSLVDYMRFGHEAGTVGTIFHVGSVGKGQFSDRRVQIIEAMREIIKETPEDQYLIMENAAGGGGRVGVTLDELSQLHDGVGSERLKLCLDTQHLWGSGINVGERDIFGKWLEELNKKIGIEHVVCLHVNDSKVPYASMKDRHENIGEGSIGKEGLRNALSQSMLQGIPLIMEVPGFDDKGPDLKNRDILQSLL